MSKFWGDFGQAFSPAYGQSTQRTDRLAAVARAEAAQEAALKLAAEQRKDDLLWRKRQADIAQANLLRKEQLAREAAKRMHDQKQAAIQAQIEREDIKTREERQALLESLSPSVRERILGDRTLFTGQQPLPATDWKGQQLGPDILKGLDMGDVGKVGKYDAMSRSELLGAGLAGKRIQAEELAKQAAEEAHRRAIELKGTPTGGEIHKREGTKAVARQHAKNPKLKERFYGNVNIEDANPAVLEAINEQVKAAQKEIDSINLSESGETAVYFGEVYIPKFRKLDREIKEAAASGKEIDQAQLDLLRDKGNTLVTFYSTHGRKAVPKDVESLVGNAAKIPTTPVIRSLTDAHDSAVLAEDIARDIVALKDAVGEDAMLKKVGIFDRPVAEIQKTLGLFVDSKQFQKIEKLIQKSQGLNNIVLKIRSGAAVTESEAARFLKEFADPSRQNYFTALQNFAENERNKARMALKTQQDAGYVFNKNLVDAIGAEEAAPTAKEPSKYQGLSSEEARQFDLLKKTDPALMNPKMKELLELYTEKSGGK